MFNLTPTKTDRMSRVITRPIQTIGSSIIMERAETSIRIPGRSERARCAIKRILCERGRQLRRPQYALPKRYLPTQPPPKRRGIVFFGCVPMTITDNPMASAIVTAQKVIHMVFSLSAQRACGDLVSPRARSHRTNRLEIRKVRGESWRG